MSELKVSQSLLVTKWKKIAVALASFAAAYITGSLAVDTGSWWLYFATMGLLLIGAKLLLRAFRRRKES